MRYLLHDKNDNHKLELFEFALIDLNDFTNSRLGSYTTKKGQGRYGQKSRNISTTPGNKRKEMGRKLRLLRLRTTELPKPMQYQK